MLATLIEELRTVPPQSRGERAMGVLLSEAAAAFSQFERPLIYRPNCYTRTCAYYDDRFEILLLNWAQNVASAIHDHGGQHCWLTVLSGQLQIENYERLDNEETPGRALVVPRDCATLGPGDLDVRSGPFDIHRVAAGRGGAISLHVYAGPLRSFLVYDEFGQRCEPAHGGYDEIRPQRVAI
ncbi:MAG TPA: cysteine dioxygenase family protein [Candidatus Baltobacteraceae bacterium]|jgi:cysteine dioxygenase